MLAGFNDLATTHPQLAGQWHPDLNDPLTPQMVAAGSPEGHVWKASVYSRAGRQQRGCPVCAGAVNGKRKLRYEKMMAEIRAGHIAGIPCD